MSFAKTPQFLKRFQPELSAGGFSKHDGTIEFYGRVSAIAGSKSVVLDYGAGRGAWFVDEDSEYRKRVRTLKGLVSKVVGCDIEPSVLENQAVDEAFVVSPGEKLPLDDGSVDIVVSDYVFEHVSNPD